MSKASPVPSGFRTLTPHLVLRDASRAIEFYKKAFGAVEIDRMAGPDGKSVMHATLQIGDSLMMLCDEFPQMQRWVAPDSLNGTTVAMSLYVDDCDSVFERAVAAGATVSMPMCDAFWGDRLGKITDPFGHEWQIATHKQDLTPDEIEEGAKAFFAQMAQAGQ